MSESMARRRAEQPEFPGAAPVVVRASSLSGYPDCGRRWAARTFRVEIKAAGYALRDETQGIGLVVGSSIHESARVTLQEKASAGSLPPENVATDAAVDHLKERISYGVQYDEKITPSATDAQQQAVRMARSYYRVIAPQIEPIIVEKRLEGAIPWSENQITVSGQPDVVAREPGTVVDLKGGSRLGYHVPQIGAYGLLARTNDLGEIEAARIDWVPRVTMKKPQPTPVEHHLNIERAEQTATNILRHIDAAISTFRRGDEARGLLPGDPAAFMSNPSSQLCSPKYCPAHSCGANGWCLDGR